ncbi:MAG: hypothetical protein AVDCRST_MAG15-2664, partial [uncultured Rubellimicrobium sp.]
RLSKAQAPVSSAPPRCARNSSSRSGGP